MSASTHSGREIAQGLATTRQPSSNNCQNVYSTPLGGQAPLRRTQVPVHSTLCSTFLAMGSNSSKSSATWS